MLCLENGSETIINDVVNVRKNKVSAILNVLCIRYLYLYDFKSGIKNIRGQRGSSRGIF